MARAIESGRTAWLLLAGAAVGFGFFIYSIVGWLMHDAVPGWTSIMAATSLLGGMQFLMLGVIGAYLGRLYDQSKGRPLFLILYIGLIVFFAFFYTAIVFNPTETADNLKKHGGFIPGIRPGPPTAARWRTTALE